MTRSLLTVELVPRTCWFTNVRSHVSVGEWDQLKRITYRRAGYCCEVCGGRGPEWPVECHEIFAYDDERLVQRLAGLVALCPRCHEVKHIGLATARGRASAATDHLAAVNDWTLAEAEEYVEECFAVWERRSSHKWRLDLSLLHDYGTSVPARAEIEPRLMASGVEVEPDYPEVRDGYVCPLCRGDKEQGLLACWACYKNCRMRDGNAEAERLIARAEADILTKDPDARTRS